MIEKSGWGIVGLEYLFQPWGAAFDHSEWYYPSELQQIGAEAAVPAATSFGAAGDTLATPPADGDAQS
ncbi:MAG TPA: hypothetical protein VNP98_02055 [Chthoniobacterales bacterium]|nr:hypothetical protein [Chthoniobacterales bacterium]